MDRLFLAKHVVMFVHMKNEPWSGKRPLCDGLLPILKGFVVVVHNLIHWPVRPIKQFVEPVEGIIEEVKVVQVYVEDRGHHSGRQRRTPFFSIILTFLISPAPICGNVRNQSFFVGHHLSFPWGLANVHQKAIHLQHPDQRVLFYRAGHADLGSN